MFANTKMHAFTYKQHQDYLYVIDKETFFFRHKPLPSPVFCVKNYLAHDKQWLRENSLEEAFGVR